MKEAVDGTPSSDTAPLEADDTFFTQSPPAPGAAPRRLGDYLLLEEIARGGMGVVYRARQLQLERIVALKVIVAGAHAEPKQIHRLRREARAAARLHHPGIVPVHDLGHVNGVDFFTMEFVEGCTLADQMREAGFTLEQGVRWIREVCDAMHYAHINGILHRDLKPANIMIRTNGSAVVTDFGLAKDHRQSSAEKTQAGAVMGTPEYMSPEQVNGEPLDLRTDVYALGGILYRMASGGVPPYQAVNRPQLLYEIAHSDPTPLAEFAPQLDRDLTAVIDKAVRRDRGERYVSTRALGEDLDRYLAGEPVAARPPARGERLLRFYRNYRAGVIAVALVLAALTTMLIVAVGARREAERHRRELEKANAELLEQTRIARAALERQRVGERRSRARSMVNQAIELYRARGDKRRVARLVAEAERVVPEFSRLLRLKGQLALDSRQWKLARRLLDRASEADPEDPETYFLLFRWFYEQGLIFHPDAERMCRAAARFGTDTAIGWWARARIELRDSRLLSKGKRRAAFDRALKQLERAIQLHPDFYFALLLGAEVLTELDRFGEAIAVYDRLLLFEGKGIPYLGRGNTKAAQKRFVEALEDYALALEHRPDMAEIHFRKAVALSQLGRLDQALAAIDEAVRRVPDDWRYLNTRGICLRQLGRYEEALACFESATKKRFVEEGIALILANRALTWKKLRRPRRALADLTEAIRSQPQLDELYLYRGDLLLELGRPAQAEADYSKAIELAPGSSQAHNHRGVARYALRRMADALADWRQAVSLDPTSASAWYNVACGLAATGKKQQAVAAFVKAVGLGFPDGELARTDPALDPIRGDARFQEALRKLK